MRLTATVTYRIFVLDGLRAASFGAGSGGGGKFLLFTPEAIDRGTGMPPKISSQNYFCFLVLFVCIRNGFGHWPWDRKASRNHDPFNFSFVLFYGGKRYGYDGLASQEKRWIRW